MVDVGCARPAGTIIGRASAAPLGGKPAAKRLEEAVLPTVVAVTGASAALGRALLEFLDADSRVQRIVGVDLTEPPMPVAKLDFIVADRVPPDALGGVDVIVHLPVVSSLERNDDVTFAAVVTSTQEALQAAAAAGITRFVLVSSAAVYGADPDNDVPLDDSAPRRAGNAVPLIWQRILAEELVEQWAAEREDRQVTILRPAPMLGPGVDSAVTRLLEAPRLPVIRGHRPPLQVVYLDDVASAAALAATTEMPGAYNVAADGWVAIDDVAHLLGRRIVEIPEQVAIGAAAWLWRRGLSPLPPAALPYLMHPWVVANSALRQCGWAPTTSNRQALRAFAVASHGYRSLGSLRVHRRSLYVAGAAALAAAVGVPLQVLRTWRLRRRGR